MSDFERVCWENAERRRREERSRGAETMEALALEERRREYGCFRIWAKALRIGSRVIVWESAVLCLLGLPGWAAAGLTAAALFRYLEVGFRQEMGGKQNGVGKPV